MVVTTGMALGALISGLLSLFGSSVILLSGLLLRGFEKRKKRLVMFLSIADFFASFTFVISAGRYLANGKVDGGSLCTYESITVQFFETAAVLWALHICMFVFVKIVLRRSIPHMEKIFHATSWGIALITTVLLFSLDNAYGSAGLWCWITATPSYARILFLYDFVIGTMMVIIVCYTAVSIYVKRSMTFRETNTLKQKAIIKLVVYPLGFSKMPQPQELMF
jgi:hypothetical protein